MKRLVNFRAPLSIAVGFILGIISCYQLILGNFYFALILTVLLVLGLVTLAVCKRQSFKIVLVVLIATVLGFSATLIRYQVMQSREIVDKTVTVSGRVCDVQRNGDNANYVYYLEDCVDADSGEKLSGRVQFTFYGNSFTGELNVGDVVMIHGTLSSTYPFQREVKTFYLRYNVNYKLYDATLLSRAAGPLKLAEKVRNYVYDLAMEYMPQNGSILYALLTGDRNAMSDETSDVFTRAGIVHLLAVSGLHVGFIVALVCFALRRLRLHPLLECAIVAIPLTFYAYVCNFAPSVLRAALMVVCTYVARAVHGRYDLLSSLSFAAVVILAIQPLYLFDVGFQLSFLSVYGIATLHAPLIRLMTRRKVRKLLQRLINLVAVSVACTLATVFVVASTFSEVPIFGAIVNVVAIPLVSLSFVLAIFGLVPFLSRYVLFVVDKLLQAVVWCAETFAKLDVATVSLTALAVTVVIAVVIMFIVGGFVNLSKKGKAISCSVCALLLAVSLVVAVAPVRPDNQATVVFGYGDVVTAAISDKGDAAIVGEFDDAYAVSHAVEYLKKFRVKQCTLYFVNYSLADNAVVKLVFDELPVSDCYALTNAANDELDDSLSQLGVAVIHLLPNSIVSKGVTVRSLYDGELRAVNVSVGIVDMCTVYGEDAAVGNFFALYPVADLYVLPKANNVYSEAQVPTLTLYQSALDYNYGANKYGNFTIRQKDDTILLTF